MENIFKLQVGCFVLLKEDTHPMKKGYWYKVLSYSQRSFITSKGLSLRTNVKAVKYPWTPIRNPNPDHFYIVEYKDGSITTPLQGFRNMKHRNESLENPPAVDFTRDPFAAPFTRSPKPWHSVRMKIAPVSVEDPHTVGNDTRKTREERAVTKELDITL